MTLIQTQINYFGRLDKPSSKPFNSINRSNKLVIAKSVDDIHESNLTLCNNASVISIQYPYVSIKIDNKTIKLKCDKVLEVANYNLLIEKDVIRSAIKL